jgi:hypothetical protein
MTGLIGNLDVHRNRQHGQLAQVLHQRGRFVGGMHRGRRAHQQQPAVQRMAHVQHGLGDVHLVVVQMARQAFKVAQHLKAGDAQATGAHRSHCGLHAVGVAHDVFGCQHKLREAGVFHGLELGLERPCQRDGVHPEVVNVSAVVAHDFAACF